MAYTEGIQQPSEAFLPPAMEDLGASVRFMSLPWVLFIVVDSYAWQWRLKLSDYLNFTLLLIEIRMHEAFRSGWLIKNMLQKHLDFGA